MVIEATGRERIYLGTKGRASGFRSKDNSWEVPTSFLTSRLLDASLNPQKSAAFQPSERKGSLLAQHRSRAARVSALPASSASGRTTPRPYWLCL